MEVFETSFPLFAFQAEENGEGWQQHLPHQPVEGILGAAATQDGEMETLKQQLNSKQICAQMATAEKGYKMRTWI